MEATKYLRNTRQEGEASEMLSQLENNSVALAFLDPQYEKVSAVLVENWPLHYQSEYQIINILKEVERVLKPSGFCLIWINREILRTDRIHTWLLKSPKLKIVDCLVWYKNFWGYGNYFRSNGEYAYLLQKTPKNSHKFTDKGFSNIWEEKKLSGKSRKHPHQKPYELAKKLILATTKENELVIDPMAGSFIVLEACEETKREFLGVELAYNEIKEHRQQQQERERERESRSNNEQMTATITTHYYLYSYIKKTNKPIWLNY